MLNVISAMPLAVGMKVFRLYHDQGTCAFYQLVVSDKEYEHVHLS